MANRVMIVQAELTAAQQIADLFDDVSVWSTEKVEEAQKVLRDYEPDLLIIDLHLPGNGWLKLLQQARHSLPETPILLTRKRPDYRRELLARGNGAEMVVPWPLSREKLARALGKLNGRGDDQAPLPSSAPPQIKVPLRVKITYPYVLLSLILAIVAGYIVTQVVRDSVEERFTNQLIEAGRLSADRMVQEENERLQTLRLIAHTRGVPEGVLAGDAEGLRAIALPIAINAREEAIEILDRSGTSVLSLHREGNRPEDYKASRGEPLYASWKFVQKVLEGEQDAAGDKFSGAVSTPWGDYFYVAGPLHDEQGRVVGAILVGQSLASLVQELAADSFARLTLYGTDGRPLGTTLHRATALDRQLAATVLAEKSQRSFTRDLAVATVEYGEILGPWEVRQGVNLGIIGAALPKTLLVRPAYITQVQIITLVAAALLLIILVGFFLANRIARPLLRIVQASTEVANGNLNTRVDLTGNDEIAVLSHSFNQMVSNLREGEIYRDLLGRTVSPEVREQLRQVLGSGHLHLEGQNAVVTILMTDIRGFTTICEATEPARMVAWLNEYYSELVPLITAYDGVVARFDGDSILAYFGLLPYRLSPQESAYAACQVAVDIMTAVDSFNVRRAASGEPPFITGIGINTGLVTAGGIGSSDRLQYTLIGDPVNTTQRLESFTRHFNATSTLISQHTYEVLGEWREEFRLEGAGAHTFKGKSEPLQIYRLWPPAEIALLPEKIERVPASLVEEASG